MKQPLSQPTVKLAIAVAVAVVFATSSAVVYNLSKARGANTDTPTPESTVPVLNAVTALGRLEPQGEVIKLSGTASIQGARVEKILVGEGDNIRVGQVIAILDNRDRLQAALEAAIQQVNVSRANLDKVKAGAKQGEIEAQRATISRLVAQLQGEIDTRQETIKRLKAGRENALKECQRYDQLLKDGAVTASNRDSKCLEQETSIKLVTEAEASLEQSRRTLQQQIREGEANLDRIREVRPVDVQQASADVQRAIASQRQAQAELELAYVRAPITGQVLKIHTRPGETINNNGIAELGKTDQMLAVAEVYESDIGKVRLGQKATIVSEGNAFEGELEGIINQIGLQIGKKDILNTDPAADVDARVVEVKIRLNPDSSRRVSGLTNSKVVVKIYL